MPKFKNSGTGYDEMPLGADQFPQQRESPEGSSGEPETQGRDKEQPNPNDKAGPQVY